MTFFQSQFVEDLSGRARQSERFLGIILKHVNRLQAIVEDLLMLSHIEDEVKHGGVRRVATRIADVFRDAVQICRPMAEEKRIEIEIAAEEKIAADADPALLEQSIVNLLDNAVKYSPPERKVRLEARREGKEIRISVQDRGIGIEKKHLPRLFERFYRIDKSRSRTVGGSRAPGRESAARKPRFHRSF